MHQPEVVRLARFLLALALVLPVARSGWSASVAAAFLAEFLTEGRVTALSALTPAPVRRPLPLQGVAADRFTPTGLAGGRPLVLVHGLTPAGKDDPRLQQAAGLLARAGFDVVVPTIPGLTRGRLRPDDAVPVVAALAARDAPTALVSVSVGAGPALLAAADPRVRDRVRVVVSLGGYASARELVRYYLTGGYAFGAVHGRVAHDPRAVEAFVRANADLLDDATRALLRARAFERIDARLDSASPELERLFRALSPADGVSRVRARLLLVHGRADQAVPYTESLRLAAARPERTRLVVVGLLDHVEGDPAGGGAVPDLLALWSVMYELLAAR
ncbi:MAG: hypothetical protein A3F92_10180 [Candidatus Rokubacteria bacterium RIFCSPLOWO2_12_FULL_71_22]|nr:MAG: hypothetical protein A3F92_10180 [Candidatus Rokubacteria bacterium RIFCSPLOWO2_12_FULL_71_22]